MGGGRGIICINCKKTIDRYSDIIKCAECDGNHHLECENLSLKDFRTLVDSKCVKDWKCSKCKTITSNKSIQDSNEPKEKKDLDDPEPE